MKEKILVVNYKTGNVDSVVKAVKLLGYDVIFSSKKKDLDLVKKIILPGQGSYDFAIKQLEMIDLKNSIVEKVVKENIPVLGICLGMQILSSLGFENKKTSGLNLIPGEVKFMKDAPNKLPHLGWNTVKFVNMEDKIFKNLNNNNDYYFIHSYYFKCKNSKNILATTKFNQVFPAIVKEQSVYGIQFHPEKSLKNGLKLIENFLGLI